MPDAPRSHQDPTPLLATGLSPCKNPLCERKVAGIALYCCAACALAHEGGYEIHEGGPLGHSEGCNQRHAERSTDA